MDITPNMTTVAQILNFGIAYGMIRVFLCKPVVVLLQQEEDRINQLHTAIMDHTKGISVTKDNFYRQWYIQHQFFIAHRPAVDTTMLTVRTDVYTSDQLTLPEQREIGSLVDSLADSIVSKVLYGNK